MNLVQRIMASAVIRSIVTASAMSVAAYGCYNPEYFQSTRLEVNEGHKYEYVYMSRREGEDQLSRLAMTAKKEDAWFFFEVEGHPSSNMWVNVGYNTDVRRCDINGTVVSEMLENITSDLAKNNLKASMSFYHIHPLFVMQDIAMQISGLIDEACDGDQKLRKMRPICGAESSSNYKRKPSKISLPFKGIEVFLQTLSVSDLLTFHYYDRAAQNYELKQGGNYIVGPAGVSRYSITPQLYQRLSTEGTYVLVELLQEEITKRFPPIVNLNFEQIMDRFNRGGLQTTYRRTLDTNRYYILDL